MPKPKVSFVRFSWSTINAPDLSSCERSNPLNIISKPANQATTTIMVNNISIPLLHFYMYYYNQRLAQGPKIRCDRINSFYLVFRHIEDFIHNSTKRKINKNHYLSVCYKNSLNTYQQLMNIFKFD